MYSYVDELKMCVSMEMTDCHPVKQYGRSLKLELHTITVLADYEKTGLLTDWL